MLKSETGKISYLTRAQDLESLEHTVFDLLILGGGINGAGVAREAALRGLHVVLVEANDFAEGTSSRSSKLIHGGIRYLENLEFGLVFESLNERNRLFDLAPHLVHPLKFMLPIYEGARHPMWKLSLGMWLYDALSLFEAPELHQRWSKSELLTEMPYLQDEGLKGGFSYYDAYTEDDRLVLETLRSAAATGYARVINYCEAVPELTIKDDLLQLRVRDKLSSRTHVVRARHIVSTLGPWTDFFSKELIPNWSPVLQKVFISFLKRTVSLCRTLLS
jgi:glycerol-3-phosphate dehydrogenase